MDTIPACDRQIDAQTCFDGKDRATQSVAKVKNPYKSPVVHSAAQHGIMNIL